MSLKFCVSAVAAAIVAGLTLISPRPACAEIVYASATGSILNGSRFNESTSAGAVPADAAVAFQLTPGSSAHAFNVQSHAEQGSLSAYVEVNVSNTFGASEGTAAAMFSDRWTITDQPLDATGRLRLTLRFDGTASGSASNATLEARGKFELNISSETSSGNVLDQGQYRSGFLPSANELVQLEMDFLYGRPIFVRGDLVGNVRYLADPLAIYTGHGIADFANTAELAVLEVRNAQGAWTTDFALSADSGARYPFQTAVPLPPTLVMLPGIFVALAFRPFRRRG